jgi:hypothetical protein
MQSTEHLKSGTCHEQADAPVMGRLTLGGRYLELPIDDQHKANRKVLGGLGRDVKDSETGKRIFTFQQLAEQLA